MLCESKSRIGFLGACFFIGVLVASTILPIGVLSDMIGRKWIYVATLAILVVSSFGFIIATTLDELYIYMFLLGITYPGRIIVAVNYAYEFQLESWKEWVQPINQYVGGFTLIFTALYFQVISNNVLYIEVAHLIFAIFMTLQVTFMFPESPRYNYSKAKFAEAKADLAVVAKVNGVKNFNPQNFVFDTEKEQEDIAAMSQMQLNQSNQSQKVGRKDGGNLYGITNAEFAANVTLMCLMFTCFSFSFWLADFQVEYLGTNIFILFYANGFVFIASGQINLMFYEKVGLRNLIFYCQAIAIVAATYIVLVQQKVFRFSDDDTELIYINLSIPIALLFLSCAVQVGFTAVMQAAYQDERIFPFSKKASAINIIIFASKTASIGAPFVNEADEPIPILVMVVLSVVTIGLGMFYKTKEELDSMQQQDAIVNEEQIINKDDEEDIIIDHQIDLKRAAGKDMPS